ncbi:hypothetical protein DV702_01625 [Sporosarcina sp. PTS2304]|uniref:hypothetical protein n=1 Tax=Sporosarcina sp. PTS2304 TaxID=2283194 RepID=UPI000E0D8BAA|nr:hypothetical protein [Sporosarcina sp. PTS2304]AXH98521.1 hypothetical protein DV702_01625 [Sporosarcina sp. PTS2304]
MSQKKPLLFVNSPVIRKHVYKPLPEEESTSIFEIEHTREEVHLQQPSIDDMSIEEDMLTNPQIQPILYYLDHPFRKELYQPIEVITKDQVIKGKIHELDSSLLWMMKDHELISIALGEITDIKWKQQSFTI